MSATTGTDLDALLAELPRQGAPLTRTADVPVSEHAIRVWRAAIGESYPVHDNPEAERRAGHDGVVAPDAMLQTWTMPIGEHASATAPTLHARVRAAARAAGLGAIVATDYEQEYLRPIRPGELLTERSWVEAVSTPKTTALGPGRFVTFAFDFVDSHAVPVGRMRTRSLYFAPAPRPGRDRRDARRGASEGCELEPLDVPLSRTLIIATALASNDQEPVHHDHEVARAQGLDDIIASIVTTAGIVLRYAGERSRPDLRARSLRLRLARPAFPGDVLTLRGSATPHPGGACLTVRGDHARGEHVTAEVGLAHRS